MGEKTIDPDELEKALDSALESLEKSKKVSKKDDGQEAEPKDQEENEETDEDEEEDEEYEKSEDEPDFESLSKSIPDAINENEEASEVVDAMPFVKALVDSVEDQMVELTKAVLYLSDKIEDIESSMKKSGKVNVAQAKLVKSISESVREIGGTAQPRKAYLGKNITLLKKSDGEGQDETIEMSKGQVMSGLTELHKSNKITLDEVIKYEAYVNAGRELPESLTLQLASTKS